MKIKFNKFKNMVPYIFLCSKFCLQHSWNKIYSWSLHSVLFPLEESLILLAFEYYFLFFKKFFWSLKILIRFSFSSTSISFSLVFFTFHLHSYSLWSFVSSLIFVMYILFCVKVRIIISFIIMEFWSSICFIRFLFL